MMTPEWWYDKIYDIMMDAYDIDTDLETEAKLIKIIKEIQDDARTTKSS